MRSLRITGAFVHTFCAFQLFVECTVAAQYLAYSLVRDAELGVEYKQVIDHSSQYIWRYNYDKNNKLEMSGDTFAIRTKVDQQVSDYSLITFEVRHFHQTLEWSLPVKSSFGRVYTSANRTLCTYPGGDNSFYNEAAMVQVTVYTQSMQPVAFTLEIVKEDNTIKSFGKNVQAQISPSSPLHYRVVLPQNAISSRYSLLYITSNDNICTTVSIKHSSCSTGLDSLQNFGEKQLIRSQHTMTKKSAINLKVMALWKSKTVSRSDGKGLAFKQ